MINNVHNFTKKLTALLAYFQKPLSEEIKDVWFLVCNQALTDEEFDKAFELTIRRSSFLPPTDEFVNLVKGDRALFEEYEDSEVWHQIKVLIQIAKSTDKVDTERRRAYIASLAPVHAHALSRTGTLAEMSFLPNLEWKRSEFLDHCKMYRSIQCQQKGGKEAQAIAPSTLPALSHGVGGIIELRTVETGEAVTLDGRSRFNGLGNISIADIDVGF